MLSGLLCLVSRGQYAKVDDGLRKVHRDKFIVAANTDEAGEAVGAKIKIK